jgi:putative membrane protein
MKKVLIYLLCAFGGPALKAQIPQPDPDTTAKHFLIVASIGNLQEASAGQLAVQKAKNPDVRAFGQMMVKDHGEAEQKLLALAKSRGITLPAAATGGVQGDLNLKNAGDNFDKLYVHNMVAGHGNTVQTFEAYTINGKDPVVKAFAQQMLPTLKAHLAAIKALNENMK